MTAISDIFDIPTQVHQGDFVLRLTEGVTRPADTLGTYVVTPQLEICFDQALGLIKSALESNTSKGAYLHGSFGSGKSHFMVERSQRDEVRRIAVPLQLGDMGETHFVLRDAWKSRFLRKQAEEGMSSLTVRRLRGWMDQPEAMGLPRDVQNLVIMGFAWQGNYAFSLHGGPVEPRLDRLDDELELREQPLPDEAVWLEATQRLAAILGVVTSPLLNATSLATWVVCSTRIRSGAICCNAISNCQAADLTPWRS